MFKNNFFRKVCITQLIFLTIICILSNYSDFVTEHLGFCIALIFLVPYEFIYQKDFDDYILIKAREVKRKEMND